MSTLDLTAGDLVRLRDGSTLAVNSLCTSYSDASGEHEGPFVTTRDGGHRFVPVSEVVEVVAPNPHRCKLCGGGVTAKDPERYPYCSVCHYTGQVEETQRAEQLAAMATALGGPAVAVWHTGGGCMMLAVTFSDEPDVYYGVTDGEASLPAVDDRPLAEGGWGLIIRYEGEEADEGETILTYHVGGDSDDRYWSEYPDHSFSDAQVVEAILADRARRGR